ncbi:glycine--tRNA ligase subunit beta [Lentisalinibacter sediminis]|uniref:glycine--tRNA ligase subunit beta n=1 Tax=Lentisalinibacter sediminis TaxID=2992237 RepID=UPI00386B6BA2
MSGKAGGEPRDLLVEIGTEELPPTALRGLMQAFAGGLGEALEGAGLSHGAVHPYASPRRLAVLIESVPTGQPDEQVETRGPPVTVAFDDDGNPTRAAQAFAGKCGVAVEELERVSTPKGEWLAHRSVRKGRTAAELIPELVQAALDRLPVPRRMRWGDGDAEFVRPVHWLVMLLGDEIVPARLYGLDSGRYSRGHRVHAADREIAITDPGAYVETLREPGSVVVDFDERRDSISRAVTEAAAAAGGHPVSDAALMDEVAALNEWPVAVTGSFDPAFLELPREVLVSTLQKHQRYFPVERDDGALVASFIAVANLESREPEKVREGNERVVKPRLADAAFFWEADRRMPLSTRRDEMQHVVYQRELGTLLAKSQRVAALAGHLARELDAAPEHAVRAAELARADLLTDMVGEFPDLQGIMGGHYARADGEPEAVAAAIAEQYLPRYAGDALPATEAGRILALADRLDTLAGIFAIGRRPTGNRDPFGLRRGALGLLRIVIEGGLELDLKAAVAEALSLQPVSESEGQPQLAGEIYDFVMERLRAWYAEREPSITPEMFQAVLAREPRSPLDFDARLRAVAAFTRHSSAESLSAANKRIANILRQAKGDAGAAPDAALLKEAEEKTLFAALGEARAEVEPLLAGREYTEVLDRLALLREPVDDFFDHVLVMDEDVAVRRNRLGLLGELRGLFLEVADISRLSTG